jgi:prepilin-type N-terminal cleavage/methylation domain-containing protein/prepilin-type processing-associated H-X9-DG protein
MPTSARATGRRAFTLVELLVVIGIIALLISILLPALNKARKQASTVKCAAALQELGHCVQMYVTDNRGWMLPARAGAAGSNLPSAYNLAEMDQYAVTNPSLTGTAWWYMFISKYVSKSKGGVDGSAGSPNSAGNGFMNTIVWGCPEYRPHKNNQATPDEFTRVYTGYGFNSWPTFSATNPASGTSLPANINGLQPRSTVLPSATGDYRFPSTGMWFKFTQYRNPAQRAMIGDSENWELFAKGVPAADGTMQPQLAWTYSISTDANNTTEVYRHGKYPTIVGANYSSTGGRVAFNLLYCDGHVATVSDRAESYRSLRMRFPG